VNDGTCKGYPNKLESKPLLPRNVVMYWPLTNETMLKEQIRHKRSTEIDAREECLFIVLLLLVFPTEL